MHRKESEDGERERLLCENAALKAELECARRKGEDLWADFAWHRDILANIMEWYWEVNEQFRFTRCSEKVQEVIGYSREEILGRSPLDILVPEERKKIFGAFSAGIRHPAVLRNFETWVESRNGARICVLTSGFPLKDSEGRVRGFRGVSLDITERKRVEGVWRESEARFSMIVNQFPGAVWTTDRDLRFTLSKGDGLDALGFQPNQVVGMTVDEVSMPNDPDDRFTALHQRALAGEKIAFVYHPGDLCFDTRLEPFTDASGQIVGVLGIAINISDREREQERSRNLEQQLLRAQKMETIGRLAGGVAHDFNNILTVINATAEVALMFMPPTDPHTEAFEEIRRTGERGANLTRQLLAFSRKQNSEPRVINLNRTLLEMDKMFRRLIGEHIELMTIPDEALLPVKVDPGQIEQVLTNLVVNASDAMSGGGKLTIETRNVHLDEKYARAHPGINSGRYVLLKVADTGVGMSEELIPHVFEPFFTTKPLGKGTGLGLSICYGIVKQSGGDIQIESAPGEGAIVSVYLPAVEDASKAFIMNSERAVSLRGTETVLVAEDDDNIRQLVVHHLAGSGYTVLSAANGDEALAIMQRHRDPIHLLVTDVVMPLMGGRELAERAATLRPGMRILFMSGYNDESIVHRVRPGKGSGFIHKPFRMGDIMRKIRETLEG